MDREAFEQAVRETPRDLTLRKVYADWLEEQGFDDEALYHRNWTVEKQDSLEWMTHFAEEGFGDSYENVMAKAAYHIENPATDFNASWGKVWGVRRSLFWDHYEVLTGKRPGQGKTDDYFTGCGCSDRAMDFDPACAEEYDYD